MNRTLAASASLAFLIATAAPSMADTLAPIALPAPHKEGGKTLTEALALRATSRSFAADPLPQQLLADLLWAGWGVNRPDGRRTAPSARNWQEIDVVAVMASGAYVYDAPAHTLKPIAAGDLRALTGTQSFVKDAPLTLVFVANTSRMQGSPSDTERTAWADAAFISQNVSLFCAAQGLATGVRASVDRAALGKALALRGDQTIVFAQSVGFPKDAAPRTTSNGWFTATAVADGVWRLDDHGSDNMYLVAGKEKALLVDTGIGVGDIVPFVRTLTPLPLVVVNTHGHPDHMGGNEQFPEVHAGRNDLDLVRFFASPEERARMKSGAPKDGSVPAQALFGGPAKDTSLLPVAGGFVFELGERPIEVIDVPGHTPGGIVLLDRKHRLLFTGDNDNTQTWMFLQHSTALETHLRTLQALEKRQNEFDTLLPGHGASLDRAFLGEQIESVRRILDGTCKGEPHHTFAGDASICTFGRAGVVFDPARLR